MPCLCDGPNKLLVKIDKKLVIGRGDVDVKLNDKLASKRHCEIVPEGGIIWITDLGSTNKTIVNGVSLEPNLRRQLRAEDKILIGNTNFKFAMISADSKALEADDIFRRLLLFLPQNEKAKVFFLILYAILILIGFDGPVSIFASSYLLSDPTPLDFAMGFAWHPVWSSLIGQLLLLLLAGYFYLCNTIGKKSFFDNMSPQSLMVFFFVITLGSLVLQSSTSKEATFDKYRTWKNIVWEIERDGFCVTQNALKEVRAKSLWQSMVTLPLIFRNNSPQQFESNLQVSFYPLSSLAGNEEAALHWAQLKEKLKLLPPCQ